MDRHFTYSISAEYAGLTISEFLRSKQYSRHILTHLKKTQEGILQNGVWAYASNCLNAGDCLEVHLLESQSSENILPIPMDLSICYEDEDLIVINKAADTPIHPSQNNYQNTLANGLAYYYEQQGKPFVYRCINRLDRDTTGLLIVAKNMLSSAILSDMIKNRTIHREYLAIAKGEVPKSGVIEAPIARKEGSSIERMVDFACGEPAKTSYKCLAYQNGYSLVSLSLETGRTHQIRVHMNYIGHPLPGDFLYYPDFSLIQRQALHSYRLSFQHPITNQEMNFTSPLPQDMIRFFPEISL